MGAPDLDQGAAAHQTSMMGSTPRPGAEEARIVPPTRLGAPMAMSLVP